MVSALYRITVRLVNKILLEIMVISKYRLRGTMNTVDYIEALKPLARKPSVYAVAKLLDIPEQTTRAYAKGRRHLDVFAADKIAKLLDVPAMLVIANVEASKENDEKRRVYWVQVAKDWKECKRTEC